MENKRVHICKKKINKDNLCTIIVRTTRRDSLKWFPDVSPTVRLYVSTHCRFAQKLDDLTPDDLT